jgi:hypothetical protein
MFNQALFEKLLILEDEVIEAVPTPWVAALKDVARFRDSSRATEPKLAACPRGRRRIRGLETTKAP